MRLAYISTYKAKDIKNWSGLGYYIPHALENQSLSLEYLGPLKERYSLILKAKQYLSNYLSKKISLKKYLRERDPLVTKNYANQVAQQLATLNTDIVFSPGTIPIAYLDCKQPIAFWTDATFSRMVNFYPEFSNLSKSTIKNGNLLEESALKRCRLAIYSSEWAAQSAIKDYQVESEKVKVVPFGANVDDNSNFDDIKTIVNSRPTNKCKLLFLGVNWYRKGGDTAFKVAKELNQMGLDTELTVAGCVPLIDENFPDFLKPMGFISKATQEGQDTINKLLAESHFLILPTIADCNPIVLCEANSLGVPCLSTNIGGIPTVIKNDVNGKTFPVIGSMTEYCNYIYSLFADYNRYQELALSSFHEYESRLNWRVAGKTVKNLLMEII